MKNIRTLAATAGAVLALCGLAACGPTTSNDAAPKAAVATTAPGTETPASDQQVARPASPTPVHVRPDASSPLVTTLDPVTELGSPTSLLVLDQRDGWLQVSLPVRPNGTTGWIDGSRVDVRDVTFAVHVDLEARTITVTRDGQVVVQSPVAVGAPGTPTPTGEFFVTDLVDTGDPHGAYGPYALGLSAHSDVLQQFGGGDGQIGIHGTNDASSIGNPVSHGCVRVPNQVIEALAAALPLGTPVTIA